MKFVTIKSNIPPVCKSESHKEYILFENSVELMRGPYALLSWKRDKMIEAGSLKYLLKIKPLKQ